MMYNNHLLNFGETQLRATCTESLLSNFSGNDQLVEKSITIRIMFDFTARIKIYLSGSFLVSSSHIAVIGYTYRVFPFGLCNDRIFGTHHPTTYCFW